MRLIILIIVLVVAGLLSNCAVSNPSGIDSPPIPTTGSIIPLNVRCQWEYLYTWYDSTGIKVPLNDRTVIRSIPDVMVLQNDTVLTLNNHIYYDQRDTSQYVYKLEWENLDSGLLVMHIGKGDLSKRGLYIAGTYAHEKVMLYDSAVLWLAYPAREGTIWSVALQDRDSLEYARMELIDTDARFYAPLNNRYGASPHYFQDSCYLYKETMGLFTTYYYYHPQVGCIGYLQYRKGILSVTCILTDIRIRNYW